MLDRIDDIVVYTGAGSNEKESQELMSFLAQNNITDINHLHYADVNQHPHVFAPLQTWFNGIEIDKFPFIIYTEIDTELKPSQFNRVILRGLQEITNSNFVNLYKLKRM